MLVCQAEAADETAREGSSRPQEVAAPIAAKRGYVEDDGGKGDLQAAPRRRAGQPFPTTQEENCTSSEDGIQEAVLWNRNRNRRNRNFLTSGTGTGPVTC